MNKSLFIISSIVSFFSCNNPEKMKQDFNTIGNQDQLITRQLSDIDESGFSHNAFIWMKDDASKEERQQFLDDFKKLTDIPEVYRVSFGFPKESLSKEAKYDVVWLCHFKSKADYKVYEKHPLHKAFVSKYMSRWKRVVVYDKNEKSGTVHHYKM